MGNNKPIYSAKKSGRLPEHGTLVKIKARILQKEKCGGFFVKQHHIDCREPKIKGEYVGCVLGAGGDVWWIQHEGTGEIGAYLFDEVTDL